MIYVFQVKYIEQIVKDLAFRVPNFIKQVEV